MPAVSAAHLAVAEPDGPVRGLALVLHGGRAASTDPVTARQLAVLRMWPFARALSRAGRRPGLAVARLRYRVRGWNEPLRSPVADTREALDTLRRRFPGAPIALVGHSMGGRTAIHVADDPAVRVVVALAPWIEPDDPVAAVTGRRLLIVHGERDRVTDPQSSARYARAAAELAMSATWLGLRGERHAMLRRAPLWHELATGFVLGALLDAPYGRTIGKPAADLVGQALAGRAHAVV